jgi:lysyl-tRNA synthetase class 2
MCPHESLKFDTGRLEKIEALSAGHHQLYPYSFDRTTSICEIKSRFADIGHEKSEESVTIAGRIYTVRNHGKTVFADLGDEQGRLQLYIRKNDVGEEQFSLFTEQIDRGDIIGVSGHLFRTKLGEITLWVDQLTLLTKSLCPLPEKFHGLKDTEARYRQRYVDLIMNEKARETFRVRSRIISLIRQFLGERGFLEFETPTLQPIYGGANARPFTTYHNCLDQTFFLRIATELYLKRLLVGGFEKIFEIGKNFRNEDIDTSHNPEFTAIEIYEAYRDYNDMMDLMEEFLSSLVNAIHGCDHITFDEVTISFAGPWRRITMEEAVREYAGIDVLATPLEQLQAFAIEHAVPEYEKVASPREFLVLFFEFFAEKQLIQPTFVHDFPIENSPLAKRHRSKEGFTERFELFINGMEIANGFSELNDPIDQMNRLEAQDRKRLSGDLEAQMVDYDFINALGYGMPPTGGVGFGVDRVVMLLTNNTSIKEVILFPSMKKPVADATRDEDKSPEEPAPPA